MKENLEYVYLIQCGEHYKIGRTKSSVKKRLAALQTASPVSLALIHTIECSDSHLLESQLHSTYRHSRGSGEWFTLSADEIQEIKNIKNETAPPKRYAFTPPCPIFVIGT